LKKQLLFAFGLLVTLPLVVLGWLGARAMDQEQKLLERRFKDLTQSRLVDLQAQIQGTVADLERQLLSVTAFKELPDRDRFLREESLARQLFVLDSDGKLIAPPPDGVLSEEEKAFLKRTERIWSGGAILAGPPGPDNEAPPKRQAPSKRVNTPAPQQKIQSSTPSLATKARTPTDSFTGLAAQADHGWVSWYWEEGLHLLFWRRLADGRVVGVEVERIALLGRVVGKLPTAHSVKGRVVLADSKGDPVYQWGGNEDRLQEKPLARLHLGHPLDAWQLLYLPDASEVQKGGAPLLRWNLLLGLLILGLALVGLAVYVYRESTREMREASRRVNFVTQVSHELKTPLTNIRLYGELLEENLPDTDEESGGKLEKYTGIIVQESERLSRLIGNVLTFSREKNGLIQLRPQDLDLAGLVNRVLAQFQVPFEKRGITVNTNLECPRPVYADGDGVEQILANLLSNVEKYAGRNAQVHIRCVQDEKATRLVVADDGPGIPESHDERIFEPFYRVSDRLSDGATGTGIGLGIARHLARLHGGDLILRPSEKGAHFEIRLPHPPKAGDAT
jgi:signal transduction histidine kinase